jgi:hypothetical protein
VGGLTIPSIFVLGGILFIFLAIVEKIKVQAFEVGPLKTAGRVVCGSLGLTLLGVGVWFGLLRSSDSDVKAALPASSPAATPPSVATNPTGATVAASPTSTHSSAANRAVTSPSAAQGRLDLQIPTIGGKVPNSNVDIRVKGVMKAPLESVWVGVHNKGDSENRWNFYSCTNYLARDEYTCRNVQVGKTDFSPGPWTIAAVVVTAKGNALITANRPALVAPDLEEAFGRSLKAYGAADASR